MEEESKPFCAVPVEELVLELLAASPKLSEVKRCEWASIYKNLYAVKVIQIFKMAGA